MRSILALALLAMLVVPSTTAATASGTSSTGDLDTWGISGEGCQPGEPGVPGRPSVEAVVGEVQEAVGDCFGPCPRDLFWRAVTLRLIDPSPVDRVSMTVVGDMWGASPALRELVEEGESSAYPTAVATYEDPEVHVWVQLGGCNRSTTVAVQGIIVEGEVSYELAY